ncbi:MAG: histidine phosphatase family protein [Eubacteriales bacterium]|nr:histidine phosphatase family protein [Eubacteriales bacterium]
MVIYLIRHGRQNRPECNVDVPLDEIGRWQAKLLGKRMKLYPVEAVYCSDLIRAQETAKIAFAEQPELLHNLQVRPELQEVHFGDLTGKPDSVVKQYYADYYDRQLELFQEGRIARGTALDEVNEWVGEYFVPLEEMWYPGGENGAMVWERIKPVVQEWMDSGKKQIAVVTHGGVIRILLCSLFGGDFAKRLMFGTSLENCSITQIHYDEHLHGFYLDRFNDYAHIEAEPSLLRGHWQKESNSV